MRQNVSAALVEYLVQAGAKINQANFVRLDSEEKSTTLEANLYVALIPERSS